MFADIEYYLEVCPSRLDGSAERKADFFRLGQSIAEPVQKNGRFFERSNEASIASRIASRRACAIRVVVCESDLIGLFSRPASRMIRVDGQGFDGRLRLLDVIVKLPFSELPKFQSNFSPSGSGDTIA